MARCAWDERRAVRIQAECARLHLSIRLVEDQLFVSPARLIPSELRDQIRAHKADLVASIHCHDFLHGRED